MLFKNKFANFCSGRLTEINFISMVTNLKLKDGNILATRKRAINMINESETLTHKCIIARHLLTPESLKILEVVIREDLNLEKPEDFNSGDGTKNKINYEIKISVHGQQSKMNFVQIRP